jgi:predicted nucleic acid-binding protein
LLRLARQEQITLAASVSLFMEYEAVCTRAEHLEASGLSARQLGLFLDGLASIVQPVEVHFLWRPQLRDPADELVLEAAVNASARALLTFNQKPRPGDER